MKIKKEKKKIKIYYKNKFLLKNKLISFKIKEN